MILTVHILAGAAIAAKTHIPILGLLFAFLSHYLLDFLPHQEYSVENISRKSWGKSSFEFAKISADIAIGLLMIFILPKSQSVFLLFAGGLFGILPDGLTFVNIILPNRLLKIHNDFHIKIHSLLKEKVPNFWGVPIQILTIISAILCLI